LRFAELRLGCVTVVLDGLVKLFNLLYETRRENSHNHSSSEKIFRQVKEESAMMGYEDKSEMQGGR
jgi:hypothetical protein